MNFSVCFTNRGSRRQAGTKQGAKTWALPFSTALVSEREPPAHSGWRRRFTWPGSRRPRCHRTRSADAVHLHPRAPGTCAGAGASWEPEGGRASPPCALTRTLCPEIKLRQTLEGFGGQTLPGPGLRQRVRGQALLSRNPRQGWEAAGWGQVMGKESDWRLALNGAICDWKSRLYKEHRLCDKPEGRREGGRRWWLGLGLAVETKQVD